jgi:hypothetical protein
MSTITRLLLAATACLCASTALAIDLDPALDAANPLAPLAQFLGSALVTKILLWMGACRAIGKLVSGKLQELLDAAVSFVRGTADRSDDHWLDSILGSQAYRLARFGVDYFFSVKLPVAQNPKPGTRNPEPGTAPPFAAAALITVSLLTVSLFTTGCGTLAPDGPYKGDKILHTADASIVTSAALLKNFVEFEFANRALLSRENPKIKDAADQVRRNAEKWVRSALLLRDAYAIAPTAENRAALERALRVLRAAVAESGNYIVPQSANPEP